MNPSYTGLATQDVVAAIRPALPQLAAKERAFQAMPGHGHGAQETTSGMRSLHLASGIRRRRLQEMMAGSTRVVSLDVADRLCLAASVKLPHHHVIPLPTGGMRAARLMARDEWKAEHDPWDELGAEPPAEWLERRAIELMQLRDSRLPQDNVVYLAHRQRDNELRKARRSARTEDAA